MIKTAVLTLEVLNFSDVHDSLFISYEDYRKEK